MFNKKNFEKGQILIILALAIVVLAAGTALAIDGSMVMNERRQDQSVADSAALAGAGAAVQLTKDHMPEDFYCGSSLAAHASVAAVQQAISNAADNNATLTQGDPDNGVTVTCANDLFRKWLDITVTVTTQTNTTFAKAISRNNLTTKVKAVSRVYPKQSLAFGNALATLGNSCGYGTGGINLQGGATVTALQGGVFSNSCIVGPNNSSFIMTGGGTVAYHGTLGFTGSIIGGPLVYSPDPLPEIPIPKNPCTNPPATWSTMTVSGTYNPGYYNGISVAKDNQHKDGTVLNPGLYCVKGDVTAQGGAVLTGHKVTIYMINGNIGFDANAIINLTAPDCETSGPDCGVPPAIRGIVIFLNPDYQHVMAFAPSAGSYFEGTSWGPQHR
jgi:hypothetical protein